MNAHMFGNDVLIKACKLRVMLVTVFLCLGFVGSANARPTLIAHWDFNLCSVSGARDEVIELISGNHGQTINGVTSVEQGKFCQAFAFDGNKAYVKIPHASNMELADGALSMWVNIPDLSHTNTPRNDGNALFSKDNQGYQNGGHLTIRALKNGAIRVRHQRTNNQTDLETRAGVLSENTWHHLVYSFGSKGIEIYVDGAKVLSNSATTGLTGNEEYIVLGASARININNEVQTPRLYDFFKGQMDDIKLYQNQPTRNDVSTWYKSTSTACKSCNSLLASYNFSENADDQASRIQDTSGNGNTATLIGNASVRIPSNNLSCRALRVPKNNNITGTAGINTSVNVSEDIGSVGSINFWYRSEQDWDSGNARQLFDATLKQDPNKVQSDDKYFFLSINQQGELHFGLEDTDDRGIGVSTQALRFEALEWVHITATWDVPNSAFKLYVNGSDASSSYRTGNTTNTIGALSDLIFGDNLSNYLLSPSTENSADGFFDNINIYQNIISSKQIETDMQANDPCSQVDHYEIIHPASALTCEAAQVSVKACANETCSELYAEPVSLALSPAGWVGGNTQSFNGTGSFNLAHTEAGEISLGLEGSISAPVTCSGNCKIVFSDAGLQFFDTQSGSNNVSALPFVAEQSLARLGLKAVFNNAGVCSALISGKADIKLSVDCLSSDAYPYSPDQCLQAFAGIEANGNGTSTGNLQLSFDSQGKTSFADYQYADAGLLKLTASAQIQGASVNAALAVISSVPATLALSTTAVSPLPAGSDFTLTLQGLGAGGSVLPSYVAGNVQAKLQRLSPNSDDAYEADLSLATSQLVRSALAPEYADIRLQGFNKGQWQSSVVRLSEVGQFDLSLQDANYLGQQISANTLRLGRVIPAYFGLEASVPPKLADACSSAFTYVGQAFGFAAGLHPQLSISAYNAQGQLTRNYAGDLWQLSIANNHLVKHTSVQDTSVYSGALSINILSTGPELSGTNEYDGQASLSIPGGTFTYHKIAAPTGASASPFASEFGLLFTAPVFTDSDGVCYQTQYSAGGSCEGFSIDGIKGSEQRYGRLALLNTFGSELQPLRVPMQSEYLDKGAWRVNKQDNCSAIDLRQSSEDISFSHIASSANNLATKVSGIKSTGTLLAGMSGSDDFVVWPLSAANTMLTGSMQMRLNTRNIDGHWSRHLNIDWDMDGDIDSDDTPDAMITFGIYRGNDRTINWREVFND